MALARQQENLEALKGQALNMAVLTQVHLALHGLQEASDKYETASNMSDVNERLYRQAEAQSQAATESELELIRRDADRVCSMLAGILPMLNFKRPSVV